MVHNFCQAIALLRGGKEERPLAEANQDSLLNGVLFMNQSNTLVMKRFWLVCYYLVRVFTPKLTLPTRKRQVWWLVKRTLQQM